MRRNARFQVFVTSRPIAKFFELKDAIWYAREISYGGSLTDVSESRGIVAQFVNGRATPEFAHIDAKRA